MKYIFKSFCEALKEVCIKRYRLFFFFFEISKKFRGQHLGKTFFAYPFQNLSAKEKLMENSHGKKEGISITWGILKERGLSGTRPLFFTDNGAYKTQKGR